jgi:hypothetical protein
VADVFCSAPGTDLTTVQSTAARSVYAVCSADFTDGIKTVHLTLPVGIHRQTSIVVLRAKTDFQRFISQVNPM